MKGKRVVLVAVLVLLASAQVAHGSGDSQALAVGQVHWTRISVCEHPQYPGLFLQYYVTDGCHHELFLYGKLTQGMVGSTIWAEGTLLENGGCQILDITSYTLCQVPDVSR